MLFFNAFFQKKKVAKFHFLKPPKTFPYLQEIARLQGSLVNTMEISRRIITGKESIFHSLNKELEKIQDKFRKENEKCREEYMVFRKKDEETIKRLEDEQKHRPEVLEIPPLRTVIIKEAIITAKVSKLNIIIEIMKGDFKNGLAEEYNKHQLEINEYRKKEENMKNIIAKKDEELKGKIVELEKITAEL